MMNSTTSFAHTRAGRQRLVATCLNLMQDTSLAPTAYEHALLAQFVAGNLTIDQVLQALADQQGKLPVPAVGGNR